MKFYLRILIAVAAVGLMAVALWRGTATQPSPTLDASSSPSPSSSVSASPLAVAYGTVPADWQSYASSSLGLKVSYPKDWQETSCGQGCIGFAPADSSNLVIGINVAVGTLAQIASEAAPYELSHEQVTVGSISWLKIVLKQPQTEKIFISHFTQCSDMIYEFGLAVQDPVLAEIFGKMIRSFSFIK
jgi:hypothetical protein